MTNLNFLRLPVIAGVIFALTACGDSNSETETKTPVKAAVESAEAATEEVVAEVKEAVTEVAPAKNAMEAAQEAMLKRGRIVWFKCRSCHELSVDGPHKVGPNLNDLMGAEAASKEGFVYSQAFIDSGVIWTEEALDAFIEKPTNYVKGTKMAFVGIKKESDRQAVIAYIKENAKPAE